MKRWEVKANSRTHRKQGVMVFVPPNFRKEFWELAQSQESKSLSEWLRPKLLRWLAEEKPELKRDVESYLKSYATVLRFRKPLGGTMQGEYDTNDDE